MPTVWGTKDGPYTLRLYSKYGEALDSFHQGDRLRISVDRDRSGKFSSLYHLMLGKLAKAINRGPASTSIDDLKKWVKIKRGWYDLVPLAHPTLDGITHAIDYKSTSFKTMGEDEFHAFARDTCDLIRAELAPWVIGSGEWQEVEQIINTIAPKGAA